MWKYDARRVRVKYQSLKKVTCKEKGQNLSVEQIQQALKVFQPADYYFTFGEPIRRAAILLPLFCQDGEWHILFTRRTERVQDHKGQVSFPGGATETTDTDLIQTALRESYEEIGLKPEDVMILGRLGQIQSISGYLISPYVGVFRWPYKFTLSTDEVEKVFSIPLEWLAIPQHHEERTVEFIDRKVDGVVFFEDYDGEMLWGLTARITLELIRALDL